MSAVDGRRAATGGVRRRRGRAATSPSPTPPSPAGSPTTASRSTSAPSPTGSAAGSPTTSSGASSGSRRNEGLDLAHAYARHRRRRATSAPWERLVESYASRCRSATSAPRSRPAGCRTGCTRGSASATPAPRRRGRRRRCSSRGCGPTPTTSPRHLTPERNHRTLELYALLLVGLALDDRPLAPSARSTTSPPTPRTDICADGVHRERSSDYHLIVLRSLVGAIANARPAGLAVPADLARPRRSGRATSRCTCNDRTGLTPALSDGDVGDFRPLLARAGDAARPARSALGGDRRARRDAAGRPASRRFPIGGYCTLRSGWGDGARAYADERWGVFDCGPLGDGGHGHYDHLAVELWADGHAARARRRPLHLRRRRRRLAPLVQGHGGPQHRRASTASTRRRTDRASRRARRRRPGFVHRVADGGVDMVVGTATSPRYDAVHTRAVALVGGDHWVVHDRLRRRPRARLRGALAPRAGGRRHASRSTSTATTTSSRRPACASPCPARCGEVTVEDGLDLADVRRQAPGAGRRRARRGPRRRRRHPHRGGAVTTVVAGLLGARSGAADARRAARSPPDALPVDVDGRGRALQVPRRREPARAVPVRDGRRRSVRADAPTGACRLVARSPTIAGSPRIAERAWRRAPAMRGARRRSAVGAQRGRRVRARAVADGARSSTPTARRRAYAQAVRARQPRRRRAGRPLRPRRRAASARRRAPIGWRERRAGARRRCRAAPADVAAGRCRGDGGAARRGHRRAPRGRRAGRDAAVRAPRRRRASTAPRRPSRAARPDVADALRDAAPPPRRRAGPATRRCCCTATAIRRTLLVDGDRGGADRPRPGRHRPGRRRHRQLPGPAAAWRRSSAATTAATEAAIADRVPRRLRRRPTAARRATSLRWHTAAALLAEQALRAVNRVRRDVLAAPPGRPRRRRLEVALVRPRLLFHCQHSLGLGHLVRSLALAGGLAERLRRHAAQRRPPAGGHRRAARRRARRPAVARPRRRSTASSATRRAARSRPCSGRRARLVLETFHRVAPDVVVVELYPFGRRKFEFELRPLLDAAAGAPCRPLVRVERPRHPRRARRRRPPRRAGGAARQRSPRRRARAQRSRRSPASRSRSGRSTPLAVPVHHTGFVVPPRPRDAPPSRSGGCSCRPAAGWSARGCCARRPTRRRRCTPAPG